MYPKRFAVALVAVALLGVGLGGCRDFWPHSMVWQPGEIERVHGEPAEGGYYKNWDPYAVEITLEPASDVNPVKTQHVLIATVKDAEGTPLPNRRVEWFIAPNAGVGNFVEVDESGWRASRGHKIDSDYAVTHTNNFDHTLTRGNDDPSDDVHLEKGQTWAVITSPVEGTTHVIAYAPAIYNWDKHKAFAVKHWWDVTWKAPPDAVNRVGTDHEILTQVMRHSDGSPLEGYVVKYDIASGPAANLDGAQSQTVRTDAQGNARVVLRQDQPQEGANVVNVKVYREQDGEQALVGRGQMTKRWIAPKIEITKTAPATARVGQEFDYNIQVTNPGQAEARNVVITDTLPEGIEYVSSNPQANVSGRTLTWNIGTLAAGGSVSGTVTVRGTRTGTFTNPASVTADNGLSDRDEATTVIAQPALALTKEGPAEVLMCEPIEYTMTIRNTGDAAATNVEIRDDLPEGLTRADNGGQSARFVVGTLEPGQARRAVLRVQATRTGEFTNTATATADGGLSTEASARTVVRRPELEITKNGPETRFHGRDIEFTITVRNTGEGEARNTRLTDTIPNGLQFRSASDGGQRSGNTVTWDLGTIQPGDQQQVTLTLVGNQIGSFTNVAQAQAVCSGGPVRDEATVEVQGRAAILLEVVDTEDPIETGNNVVYEIRVTNQGTAADRNMAVIVIVSDLHKLVASDGPTNGNVEGRTVTFEPLPVLAPKASVTYRVTAQGVDAGDARLQVQLRSDTLGDTPVTETESTHVYE